MKFPINFRSIILKALILIVLYSCGQNNSKHKSAQINTITVDESILTIDTFSTFPPEIDGCSCYFANDSAEFRNGKYIYMNDFGEVSFLKINGVITKFTHTDFKKPDKAIKILTAKNDKYEMTVEVIDGNKNGEETSLKSGVIKLKDKTGKTVTKKFYGECGC